MSDGSLDEAEDRFRRLMDDMAPAERAAFIAKIMASAAFPPHGSLPRALMHDVYATIDELASRGDLDPPELAAHAFLRHGYHAELEDRGEIATLKVDRIQG